jgi:NAD(P)-dependent dehydrogenase (short-subunit alcohol dehydrogenase family)
VAVVIGGGSGVGRGAALGLAAVGMSVVVGDVDLSSGRAVQDEISARGGMATAVEVDSTDRRSLQELAETAKQGYGKVQILVNTVGAILERRLDEATDEDWAWMIESNVMAQVRAVAVFLPLLRMAPRPAHIVTTIAGAGLVPAPPGTHLGLYVAAKRAILGYSETLREELEPEAIGVSLLCPSGVMGNLAETSARSRRRFMGPSADSPGGQPPHPRTVIPNEVIGRLVVEAITGNRVYVFNQPDEVRDALEAHHRHLLEHVRMWKRTTNEK